MNKSEICNFISDLRAIRYDMWSVHGKYYRCITYCKRIFGKRMQRSLYGCFEKVDKMEISQSIIEDFRLFSQGKFQGSMGLILKHSYYNTNLWISILKQMIGEDITMINTSRKLHTPRLAIVSSIVNLPTIQVRSFNHLQFSIILFSALHFPKLRPSSWT